MDRILVTHSSIRNALISLYRPERLERRASFRADKAATDRIVSLQSLKFRSMPYIVSGLRKIICRDREFAMSPQSRFSYILFTNKMPHGRSSLEISRLLSRSRVFINSLCIKKSTFIYINIELFGCAIDKGYLEKA